MTTTAGDSITVSRRELNKAATREAIAAAALELLRANGMNGFTADDVANAAGVSRRTFFNYFSSPEAAIASFTQKYLDTVIEQLLLRPQDEPLLESAQHALTAVAPSDLATLAETFALTQGDAQLSRFQLEAWDNCSSQIIATIGSRLAVREGEGSSGMDVNGELYLHALVQSVIACGRAAVEVWFRRHGEDISPASLARLRELLVSAIGHLRDGFHS
ncbi:TetR family transcriptional regulator [Paeniglutamicibacter antarcticus]|uniref:TetR family transcriptional regulator n=1 Tax=Arthrobacter terrae TaxID=2935737 RepID=A0A931CMZ0_9MICC|nr:TetR/AcrR family transcriptional regulator [Arthrobacter terrae]MBG0738379.1 TetR family transcriptional regulator [Arthrobacter terrae]